MPIFNPMLVGGGSGNSYPETCKIVTGTARQADVGTTDIVLPIGFKPRAVYIYNAEASTLIAVAELTRDGRYTCHLWSKNDNGTAIISKHFLYFDESKNNIWIGWEMLQRRVTYTWIAWGETN